MSPPQSSRCETCGGLLKSNPDFGITSSDRNYCPGCD